MLANLGWVDFDLGCSPGWWAATVAIMASTGPGNTRGPVKKRRGGDPRPRPRARGTDDGSGAENQ